jgi:hypothetical protein
VPFSKENIRYTVTVIACLVIALATFGLFAFLAGSMQSQVLAAAGTVGALAAGLSAPIIGLYMKVEKGQEAAQNSREVVHQKLNRIEEKAEAGTAAAVAEEVQKTIGKQLLEDDDFLAGLADKLAPRMKMAILPDLERMLEQAARRGAELYVESQKR